MDAHTHRTRSLRTRKYVVNETTALTMTGLININTYNGYWLAPLTLERNPYAEGQTLNRRSQRPLRRHTSVDARGTLAYIYRHTYSNHSHTYKQTYKRIYISHTNTYTLTWSNRSRDQNSVKWPNISQMATDHVTNSQSPNHKSATW